MLSNKRCLIEFDCSSEIKESRIYSLLCCSAATGLKLQSLRKGWYTYDVHFWVRKGGGKEKMRCYQTYGAEGLEQCSHPLMIPLRCLWAKWNHRKRGQFKCDVTLFLFWFLSFTWTVWLLFHTFFTVSRCANKIG